MFRRIHFSAQYALSVKTAFPLTHNVTVTDACRFALSPGQGLHDFWLGLLEGTAHLCFLHSGSGGFPVLPVAEFHNQCQTGWPLRKTEGPSCSQVPHLPSLRQASHVRLTWRHVLHSLQRSDNSDFTSVSSLHRLLQYHQLCLHP